ncbi:hypothetical protein HCN51_31690 [Nonomuraea sp. FMUSA5-5]|uniref:Uncharacterized protein n=1 Tax=Nonomuraea composti TaxID=2720023 RepID=A0ABX1BFQ2_9ACTN|nr:hypothetical protein [Nonomuraea sp. FMUSA5-5]NJP93948.1 hypothetical protein [Nonomuraea sp. FMUSA5-5]
MSTLPYKDPYMDWTPFAQHGTGCKRVGWDVRQAKAEFTSGSREVAIRAICPEPGGGCGRVFEFHVSLAPDRDPETGDVRSGEAWSSGGVDKIGYGTKPQRIGDVWLHAGPPVVEWASEDGPEWWYVTRSAEPPTRHEDTLGKVFRLRRAGRQLKGRFGGGAGWERGKYYGMNLAETREDLPSRTAAARWVEQRAAELAAAAAAGGETS